MEELSGNPMQVSLALGLTSFMLNIASLAEAVNRGERTHADVAAFLAFAQNSFAKAPPLIENDPAVNQLVAKLLCFVGQIVLAFSAETPPVGSH